MPSKTTIKIKQSAVSGNVPEASQLEQGELALNTADQKLYSKSNSGAVFHIGSFINEIDGGTSVDVSHSPVSQTLDGGGA